MAYCDFVAGYRDREAHSSQSRKPVRFFKDWFDAISGLRAPVTARARPFRTRCYPSRFDPIVPAIEAYCNSPVWRRRRHAGHGICLSYLSNTSYATVRSLADVSRASAKRQRCDDCDVERFLIGSDTVIERPDTANGAIRCIDRTLSTTTTTSGRLRPPIQDISYTV